MKKGLLSLALAGSMILMSGLAVAGVPSETLSSASGAAGCISITPAGTGATLASKGLTVSVTVVDGNGDPIAGYGFSEVWLDDDGTGDIALCQGGSVADFNTNASGNTTISGAIAGGGNTQSGMNVYLAGVKLAGPAIALDVNSPDINGDLVVNLQDVSAFSADFNSDPNPANRPFRSDFSCDGNVDLVDVGRFAAANGQSCN